jgi:hypothetical protein
VNAAAETDVPPSVVTATSAAPDTPAGTIARTDVAESTVTPEHGTPPTVTDATEASHVPVIVTAVPPSRQPCAGETDEMVAGQ